MTVIDDLVAHALVDDRAEDDVRLRVGRLLDDLGRLVDLEQAQARAAGDVEQHALGAGDVDLEQRAGDRLAGGVRGAALAAGAADAHQRRAGVLHDRAHVGEVEVDQAGHGDQVADALDALAQHVVHDAEGVEDGRVLLDDVLEPVVGDGDERVDLVLAAPSIAFSAFSRRRAPSKRNGLVTTPMVSAPRSRAISAMTGAAPDPVPPPMPAVMNTMSESLSAS